MVEVKHITKSFEGRVVLNDISAVFETGKTNLIIGRSGSGKTVLIKNIIGLMRPDSGEILYDGRDLTSMDKHELNMLRREMGMLFQGSALFDSMTVEDNIRSVLEMTETTSEYQKEKLESLIAEFGLNKVRKNLGDQLSGGERRRAEIARCLAIDPKFIMLDEPFAGVDPIAVQDIQSIVAKLKHKNIGILITDHNVYETLSICDRAYLLFEGKVLFQGTAEQLAENEIVREKYLGKDFVLRKKDF